MTTSLQQLFNDAWQKQLTNTLLSIPQPMQEIATIAVAYSWDNNMTIADALQHVNNSYVIALDGMQATKEQYNTISDTFTELYRIFKNNNIDDMIVNDNILKGGN